MNFFEEIDKISRDESSTEKLEQAWIDSCFSHQRRGAYWLEENGYQRGDAELRDALVDAMERGMLPEHADLEYWEDEDWFYQLLETLNREFIEMYRKKLEELK